MPSQQSTRPSSLMPGRRSGINVSVQRPEIFQELDDANEDMIDEFIQLHIDLDQDCREMEYERCQERPAMNVNGHAAPHAFQLRRSPVRTLSLSRRPSELFLGSRVLDGLSRSAAASISSLETQVGRRDSVVRASPEHELHPDDHSSHGDSIPVILQPGYGRVVRGSGAPPACTSPVQQASDLVWGADWGAEKYRPSGRPSAHAEVVSSLQNEQRFSQVQSLHAVAGQYLPHDVDHFDATRFVTRDGHDVADIDSAHPINNHESMMWIEADHLDSNVAPHLRGHMETPYFAPRDRIQQRVRYVASTDIWREKFDRVKAFYNYGGYWVLERDTD